MNEQEWLTGDDPARMLRHVRRRASRKRRLFACACCRRLWHLLPAAGRAAVEVSECYADRRACGRELALAFAEAQAAWKRVLRSSESRRAGEATLSPRSQAAWAAMFVAHPDVQVLVRGVPRLTAEAEAARGGSLPGCVEAWQRQRQSQCALLRDLFGNPFRPAALDPAWLAWDGGTVAKMARVIYEQGRFADLPVLADALEEAGCTDPRILAHCRSGAEHIRGCWVVDLVLEKT